MNLIYKYNNISDISIDYTFNNLLDLYQPRILVEDIIAKKVRIKRSEKNKTKVYYKLLINKDKLEQFRLAKASAAGFLLSSPLSVFRIHNKVYSCKRNSIYTTVPTFSDLKGNKASRNFCFLVPFCPTCNAYFQLTHFFAISDYCKEAKNKFMYPKATLIVLKNIKFSLPTFKLLKYRTFIKKFIYHIKSSQLVFAMRPSLTQVSQLERMDIILLDLTPRINIDDKFALDLYLFFENTLSYLKSSKDFNFEVYEIDYNIYDIWDAFSTMFYYLNPEIYIKLNANLGILSCIYFNLITVGKYFEHIPSLYAKKYTLERLHIVDGFYKPKLEEF